MVKHKKFITRRYLTEANQSWKKGLLQLPKYYFPISMSWNRGIEFTNVWKLFSRSY